MKYTKILAITFLIFALIRCKEAEDESEEEKVDLEDLKCDRALMESYDIDGTEDQVKDKNFLAPGLKVNCCSYSAQLQMYKKFVVMKEFERIEKLYKEFPQAYEKIFKSFGVIEGLAKTIKESTDEVPNSNCNKMAKAIMKISISKLESSFRENIKTAYDFLLESRKGFYCAICDPVVQPYFNITSKEIVHSQGFCAKMVEESLNYYIFKYTYFTKISRLYSEFLTKCDLFGSYRKNKFVKNDIKFYRKDNMYQAVESCRMGWDKFEAIKSCSSFCSRFNPIKYDEYLEGELDKIISFEKTLKKLIKKMKSHYDRTLKEEEEKEKLEKQKGRLLGDDDEETAVKKTKRLDEDVNEISTFNKEFKTAFIRPITYNFKEDIRIKYHINYDEPLFEEGVQVTYDLVDYRVVIKKKGLNLYGHGQSCSIDKEGAMKAFEQMNEGALESEAEFEKMIALK